MRPNYNTCLTLTQLLQRFQTTYKMGIHSCILMLLLTLSGVSAQCDENFNCTFSGCAGTNLTCYCSVEGEELGWTSNNLCGAGNDCITIHRNQMAPDQSRSCMTAEVAARSSDSFTSKLVWSNISTELNGTEIGCSANICRTDQNLNFTLLVTGCQAPNPPRNLSRMDAQCKNNTTNVTIKWIAPEPGALQLQVTHYNFSYTTDNEDSCYETLLSCMTSFDMTVTDGVQYTITVSALSNGRESQDNPQLNFDASFCNGTGTTTPGNPSAPTSDGIQTSSTPTTAETPVIPTNNGTEPNPPTTNLGPIIGGSIGALAILVIVFITGTCCYKCHKQNDNHNDGTCVILMIFIVLLCCCICHQKKGVGIQY